MFLAQLKRNHQRNQDSVLARPTTSTTVPLLPNLRQRISQIFPTRPSAPPEPEEPSFFATAPSPFGTITSRHAATPPTLTTMVSTRQQYDPFRSFRQQLELLEGFNYSIEGRGVMEPDNQSDDFGNLQEHEDDCITIKSYETRNRWRDGAIFEGPHVYEDQRTPEKQRIQGKSKARDKARSSTCPRCGCGLMKPLPEPPRVSIELPFPTTAPPVAPTTPPRLPPLLSNGTPLFARGSINDGWLCPSPGNYPRIEEEEIKEVEGGSDESRFMDPEE